MKEWSARIVMNVNKPFLSLCLVAGSVFFSCPQAQAQGVAPALYGFQEIQVHQARMGNEAATDNCGLSARTISERMLTSLKNQHLPGVSIFGQDQTRKDVLSVDLLPEVVTLQPRDKLCVSWVSFNLQRRSAVSFGPVKIPRDTFLTFWRAGLLVSANSTSHLNAVGDALDKLAAQLAAQYALDQPPELKEGPPRSFSEPLSPPAPPKPSLNEAKDLEKNKP